MDKKLYDDQNQSSSLVVDVEVEMRYAPIPPIELIPHYLTPVVALPVSVLPLFELYRFGSIVQLHPLIVLYLVEHWILSVHFTWYSFHLNQLLSCLQLRTNSIKLS